MKHTYILNKKKIQFFLIAVLFTFTPRIYAGPGDSLPHRYLSIGIKTSKDLVTEFTNPVTPSLIMSLDLHKNIRADFQFGRYASTQDVHIVSWSTVTGNTLVTTHTPESKNSVISVGLFGMHRVEKTRFYGGYRYNIIKSFSEYVHSTGSSSSIYNRKTSGKAHTILIGGEYFLASRFSLGAEVGYHIAKYSNTDSRPGEFNTNQSNRYTDASVIFRFYPF